MKITDINNASDIPKDFFVIRIKNERIYLHFEQDPNQTKFYFEEKMSGCFVAKKKDAQIIKDLILYELLDLDYNIEIINFHTAYSEHGLIEKQICYN